MSFSVQANVRQEFLGLVAASESLGERQGRATQIYVFSLIEALQDREEKEAVEER